MQVGILEGYEVPRRRKRRSSMKSSMKKKMKACARKHRVATKGFWSCVRGKR